MAESTSARCSEAPPAELRKEASLGLTSSLCHVCQRKVPAELFERDGDVWMYRECTEHGHAEALYFRDARLFREMMSVVGDYTFCRTFECLDGVKCDRCLEKAYNVVVEVTNRCNLDCPTCFADANHPHSADPTIAQVIDRLPVPRDGLLGRMSRPNVVLLGGEPTTRKDLPELIRRVVARGYIPRLSTNGVRMTDSGYLDELWEAGLRWVVLQFDGFDDEVSFRLRGERHHAHKLRAIEAMSERGFKVQLGCMMAEGINAHFAGDIIRFVGGHKRLFWISLYPSASQTRFDEGMSDTHLADMMRIIDETTEGRIRPRDFVRSMRAFALLHRLLPLPNLRQKLSTAPMILVFDGPEYFPLVRLLEPAFALKRLTTLLKVVRALPRMLLFQEKETPSFLKFLVVERLQSELALDMREASNCHMSYMTHWAFPPFDLYNISAKKRGTWEPSEEFAAREASKKRVRLRTVSA